MKRTFTFLLLMGMLQAQAQLTTPTYMSTTAGTTGNAFPFNSNTNNKLQGIYTPADFTTLPPSGYISSVFFQVGTTFTSTTQVRTSSDVRIALGYVPVTDFASTTTFFTGLDTVYYEPTRTYTALVSGDWVEFVLQSPFYYDNTMNLLVQGSTANTATNQGFTIRNASVASKRLYAAYSAATGTVGGQLGQFGLNIIPLSVNLKKFEAGFKADMPQISWTTASEQNASHFEIERSYNGKAYTKAGSVRAKGSASDYSFIDHDAETAVNIYYRMRMVDQDGTETMSKTVLLKARSVTAASFALYPNPTGGALNITLPVRPKGTVEVTVSNGQGKTVLSRAFTTADNSVYLRDMETLPVGVYTVKVNAEGRSYSGKVVKQ